MDGKNTVQIRKKNNTIKDTVAEAINCNVDLRDADLHGANLHGADLHGANLYGANLYGTDLYGANLYGTDLYGANLYGANLRNADLRNADLRGTDLYGANLYGANLRNADLRGANLYGANLHGADLHGAENVPYIPLSCPSDGTFIGWKNVKGYLVKLEIPEDARRTSATAKKCRCDKAKVLSITDLNGTPIEEILCETNTPLLYKVGEMVYPDSFDEDRWNECSHGIHFFINKQDAIDYRT